MGASLAKHSPDWKGEVTPSPQTPNGNGALVLGIGNRLCGDDGAGLRLAELLAAGGLPEGVEVALAGLPGWGLANWLEDRSTVILLDAVEMGLAAGEWRRFEWGEAAFVHQQEALSLHQPDLASGLALTEALDLLPEHLVIYAIQPASCQPGEPLSPKVAASLPVIADTILADLVAI